MHTYIRRVFSLAAFRLCIFCCCKFLFDCSGSSLLVRAFYSCSERVLLFTAAHRLLAAVVLLLRSTGCRHVGFRSHSTRAQQLWSLGMAAPQPVESSWAKGRTHVPCIGRRLLIHSPTREDLFCVFEVSSSMNGLPRWLSVKESACQFRRRRSPEFDPQVGKISWRSVWQPTPVFLPGESHGQRSLAGYSPWGHRESDTTQRLSMQV